LLRCFCFVVFQKLPKILLRVYLPLDKLTRIRERVEDYFNYATLL
jgi:hypothetical protein